VTAPDGRLLPFLAWQPASSGMPAVMAHPATYSGLSIRQIYQDDILLWRWHILSINNLTDAQVFRRPA
jgi:hypothetical protein